MAILDVCREEELPVGGAISIMAGREPIAVFNCRGEFFAIGDTCTHEEFALSDGEVYDDCTVECALHGSRFDLRTGDALSLPATGNAGSYQVWVEDGVIKIDVP
jgi:3-phenylpropionate/trans-cinnamate dioxygenase ferredoxin component